MEIKATALTGYGFQIKNKTILRKLNEDELDIGKDFDLIFHGSSYYDEECPMFLVIKESVQQVSQYDKIKPLKEFSLFLSDDKMEEWDYELLNWAIKNKIKSPKIDWYFVCSLG